MTAHKHLKKLIRERMAKTGESFAAARRLVTAANTRGEVENAVEHPAAASGAIRRTPVEPRWPMTGWPWDPESQFGDDGGKRQPTREPAKEFVIQAWFGRIGRETPVVIQVGRKYRIEPLNPKKLKHRGRTCVILELDDNFMPDRAAVKFLEPPRSRAKVELRDLVPLEPLEG